MIRLSKLSDYAVVVLGTLNAHKGEPMSAAQVALFSMLPEPTVAKVLKLMSATGLVESSRGVNGGYSLNRSAEDVSVFDIVSAIEGPVALTACVDGGDGGSGCAMEHHCAFSGRWESVNKAVQDALRGVRLSDLLTYKRAPQAAQKATA